MRIVSWALDAVAGRPSRPSTPDAVIRRHLAALGELPDATDREWLRLERTEARRLRRGHPA